MRVGVKLRSEMLSSLHQCEPSSTVPDEASVGVPQQRQLTEQLEQRRVQKEAAERERQRQDAERRRERQEEELLERLCRQRQEQEAAAEEAAKKKAAAAAQAAAAAKAEAAAKAAAAKPVQPPASDSPKAAAGGPPAGGTPGAAGERERARMREQERRRREAVSWKGGSRRDGRGGLDGKRREAANGRWEAAGFGLICMISFSRDSCQVFVPFGSLAFGCIPAEETELEILRMIL